MMQKNSVQLADIPNGRLAIVDTISASSSRVDKLAALGLLPGVELRVQQRKPVIVVECGETVLALDHELAEGIMVALVDD